MSDTDTSEPDFYDCRDREELTCTDRDEAIEEHLNYISALHPGMTEAEVLDALPETITVKGYARMTISEGEMNNRADSALDLLIENLDEEHGNPDNESNITPAMKEAARTFVKAVVADYTVWPCEVISEEEVDVEPWVREHCPDWLKNDTGPVCRCGRKDKTNPTDHLPGCPYVAGKHDGGNEIT